MEDSAIRHNWSFSQVKSIYDRPLLELIFDAAKVHREYFNGSEVQVNNLISIKTGGCPEDCHYCPQSARYATGVKRHKLMSVEEVKGLAQMQKIEVLHEFAWVLLGVRLKMVKTLTKF